MKPTLLNSQFQCLWIICISLFAHNLIADQLREGLQGGDFEAHHELWSSGYYAGGSTTSAGIFQGVNASTGEWYAYLGSRTSSDNLANGYIYQFILPNPEISHVDTHFEISFDINVTSQEGISFPTDTLNVYLRYFDVNENFISDELIYGFSNRDKDINNDPKAYRTKKRTIDIAQNGFHYVAIIFKVNTNDSLPTTFRIDNVSVKVARPDAQVTINTTHGPNGTISPNGSQIYPIYASADFEAVPDNGYAVDKWYVNNVEAQDGGENFHLNSVGIDSDVSVTFKAAEHKIHVLVSNGTVILEPNLNVYAHGASVVARARPDQGFVFAQWSGDDTSLSSDISLFVNSDLNLSPMFVRIGPDKFDMTVAHTTPSGGSTMLSLDSGYRYVLLETKDLEHKWWRPIKAKDGTDGAQIIQSFKDDTAGGKAYYETRRSLSYIVPPFLNFPIKGKSLKDGIVTSIVDHHGPFGLHKADGAIVTCRGGLITFSEGNAFGYRNVNSSDSTLETVSDFTEFDVVAYRKISEEVATLPFEYYDGDGLLFYDGHAGNDFGRVKENGVNVNVTTNTEIVAAAEGDVVVSECGGNNNQIVLSHKNGGYKTYYLHLSNWDDSIKLSEGTAKTAHVLANQRIGWAGSRGAGVGVHLHFQVGKLESDGKYSTVDPYGFYALDGSTIDPWLWVESPP